MFIKADCKHESVHEEIRLEFYNQYKQFVRFLASFDDMYKIHLKKWDIIDLLSKEGFYDMRNLTEEEQSLFETKEGCMRMLMDPILHLVKADLREFENEELSGKVMSADTNQFDNVNVLDHRRQVDGYKFVTDF